MSSTMDLFTTTSDPHRHFATPSSSTSHNNQVMSTSLYSSDLDDFETMFSSNSATSDDENSVSKGIELNIHHSSEPTTSPALSAEERNAVFHSYGLFNGTDYSPAIALPTLTASHNVTQHPDTLSSTCLNQPEPQTPTGSSNENSAYSTVATTTTDTPPSLLNTTASSFQQAPETYLQPASNPSIFRNHALEQQVNMTFNSQGLPLPASMSTYYKANQMRQHHHHPQLKVEIPSTLSGGGGYDTYTPSIYSPSDIYSPMSTFSPTTSPKTGDSSSMMRRSSFSSTGAFQFPHTTSNSASFYNSKYHPNNNNNNIINTKVHLGGGPLSAPLPSDSNRTAFSFPTVEPLSATATQEYYQPPHTTVPPRGNNVLVFPNNKKIRKYNRKVEKSRINNNNNNNLLVPTRRKQMLPLSPLSTQQQALVDILLTPTFNHTTDPPTKTFPCACGKMFERLCGLKSHVKVHLSKKHELTLLGSEKLEWRQSSDGMVVKALDEETQRNHHCLLCPKDFLRRQDLRRHIQSAHSSDGKSLRCDTCGAMFSRSDALHRHVIARRCRTTYGGSLME